MFDIMNTHESVLHVAKQVVEDIEVEFVHGSATGTSCRIKDGVPTIVWDLDFWEYIERNLFIRDTLPYESVHDQKIITEYVHTFCGILYDHLRKRFSDVPALAAAFTKLANDCNFPCFIKLYPEAVDASELSYEYGAETQVCKLLALYHELAHILFSRDIKMKQDYESMVIQDLKETISSSGKEDLYKALKMHNPERLSPQWYSETIDRFLRFDPAYSNMLEEMAADLYAVSKTHATVILNFKKALDLKILSNAILSGIYIYYAYIIDYASVCAFWDNIRIRFLLYKKEQFVQSDQFENAFDDSIIIRGQIFPWTLFEMVRYLDNNIRTGETKIEFYNRLETVFSHGEMNEEWYRRVFAWAKDEKKFNEALRLAAQIMQSNKEIEYSYDKVPDDSLIISWQSLQYHNNKGIKLCGEGEIDEALIEYYMSLTISEIYLGQAHRFTARVCNNIVTALLTKYRQSFDNIWLGEAKKYSDVALQILEWADAFDDVQATAILQNSGVVSQWMGKPREAIKRYKHARDLKQRLYSHRYDYSMAVTDVSIASAYFQRRDKKRARAYCDYALKYFADKGVEDDDICYHDLKELIKLLDE